ncbi:MAG: hypothetical protein ACTSVX_02455 [Promethearchaeota archaeon]
MEGRRATLYLGKVACSYGSWNKYINYAEIYGNRDEDNWNRDRAISRAKDEVLAALVEMNRAKSRNKSIDEYISTSKEKTVLLLGDYSIEGKKRLDKIGSILEDLGYEPLLIKDVPDNPYQDLKQKVSALGHLARFVVVDDSSKSGHLAEVPICEQNDWVTIILRDIGKYSSWMTAGVSHKSNVILEKSCDFSDLNNSIVKAVDWAEQKLRELKRKFDNTYPWRNINN